jgi:hypothetical protein
MNISSTFLNITLFIVLPTTYAQQIQTRNNEPTNVLVVVNVVSNMLEVVSVPFSIGSAANYLQLAYETNRPRQRYELPVQWLSETNTMRRQMLQQVVETSMRYWFVGRILNRESVGVQYDPQWHSNAELGWCVNASSLFTMYGFWDVGVDVIADNSDVRSAQRDRHGLWNPQVLSIIEQYPDRCVLVGESMDGPIRTELIVVFNDRESRNDFLEVDVRRPTNGAYSWLAAGFTRVGSVVEQAGWKLLSMTNENWKSGVMSIMVAGKNKDGIETNVEVKAIVQLLKGSRDGPSMGGGQVKPTDL